MTCGCAIANISIGSGTVAGPESGPEDRSEDDSLTTIVTIASALQSQRSSTPEFLEVVQRLISLRAMTSSIAYRHCSAFVLVWVICIAVQLKDVRAQSSSEVCLPNPHTSMPTKKYQSVQKSVRVKPKSPAVDWTTMASTYTHDATGQRVDQHTRGVEPESNERADLVSSGFRNSRSSLQVGFSSDHYHTTQTWGANPRPYGEWRYPNRPYSVPYGAWGPQLPNVVANGVGPWGGWGGPVGQMGPGGGWPTPHPGPHPSAMGGAAGTASGAGAGAGAMGAGAMGGAGAPMGGPGLGVPPGLSGYPPAYPQSGYPAQGYGPYGVPPYGGPGQFGVGPGNAMSPLQEEYYPQAPQYQPQTEGYFQSPYR